MIDIWDVWRYLNKEFRKYLIFPLMSIYSITGVFWEVGKIIEVPTNKKITNNINKTKKKNPDEDYTGRHFLGSKMHTDNEHMFLG